MLNLTLDLYYQKRLRFISQTFFFDENLEDDDDLDDDDDDELDDDSDLDSDLDDDNDLDEGYERILTENESSKSKTVVYNDYINVFCDRK